MRSVVIFFLLHLELEFPLQCQTVTQHVLPSSDLLIFFSYNLLQKHEFMLAQNTGLKHR